MVEVVETPEAKLKRHEDALVACMAEIERLRAENASLKANNASAHQTLRAIYADSTQPTGHRIRAAQAAIGHESAPLKAVEPAIDGTCEEIVEPLHQLVEKQRRRADEMLREARNIEVSPSGFVRILPRSGSNGRGDSDDSSSE
jgi:hypothetical protein